MATVTWRQATGLEIFFLEWMNFQKRLGNSMLFNNNSSPHLLNIYHYCYLVCVTSISVHNSPEFTLRTIIIHILLVRELRYKEYRYHGTMVMVTKAWQIEELNLEALCTLLVKVMPTALSNVPKMYDCSNIHHRSLFHSHVMAPGRRFLWLDASLLPCADSGLGFFLPCGCLLAGSDRFPTRLAS